MPGKGYHRTRVRNLCPLATLIFTCGGVTGGDALCEKLAGEDVGMDEAEQTAASPVHNFTRGRTTLGQVSWDLGDWGPLVVDELSVLFEFASILDILETAFTGCSVLLSDSSFSLAARPCRRIGEVNCVGCG